MIFDLNVDDIGKIIAWTYVYESPVLRKKIQEQMDKQTTSKPNSNFITGEFK